MDAFTVALNQYNLAKVNLMGLWKNRIVEEYNKDSKLGLVELRKYIIEKYHFDVGLEFLDDGDAQNFNLQLSDCEEDDELTNLPDLQISQFFLQVDYLEGPDYDYYPKEVFAEIEQILSSLIPRNFQEAFSKYSASICHEDHHRGSRSYTIDLRKLPKLE